MKEIQAKDLKVGDRYKSGSTIQEVKEIVKVTDKSIFFTVKRIYPDFYDGNILNQPLLTKKIKLVN